MFHTVEANDGADSTSAADAPVVDSHGLWVGERIESQLAGAAGATSTTLWRKKEEGMLEFKRHSYTAKSAAAAAAAADGAADPHESRRPRRRRRRRAAGASSKKLSKATFERGGLSSERGVAKLRHPRASRRAPRRSRTLPTARSPPTSGPRRLRTGSPARARPTTGDSAADALSGFTMGGELGASRRRARGVARAARRNRPRRRRRCARSPA